MPTVTRRIHLQPPAGEALSDRLAAIRREQGLPDAFPPEVEAAAQQAAASPRLPALDRSDLPLVTIDPPGSMDLDQALHVERTPGGYRVHYAIADVAAFVMPGDALDLESRRRGETLYGADSKIPLYPTALSEGAASLLPDQRRPALLWTIDLGAGGEIAAIDVRRACVASRARLDYAGVQAQVDAGRADPMWQVLREIGERRQARERARGGVSLPLPEQEVGVRDGRWTLDYRARLPLEDWNEQISLLTGMAAARLMVDAKIGLLRTLPPPAPADLEHLRRIARALAIDWPPQAAYADVLRTLDPSRDAHVALLTAATRIFRGAGYVAFDGALPAQYMQAAVAAPYAHATAPLRRLVDRYVGEVCIALCAKTPVPDAVRAVLPTLLPVMQASGHRAREYEKAVLDLAEASLLAARVGAIFGGAIVGISADDPRRGKVMVRAPAVEAAVSSDAPLPLGAEATVRLDEADPQRRLVRFVLASVVQAPAAPASAIAD